MSWSISSHIINACSKTAKTIWNWYFFFCSGVQMYWISVFSVLKHNWLFVPQNIKYIVNRCCAVFAALLPDHSKWQAANRYPVRTVYIVYVSLVHSVLYSNRCRFKAKSQYFVSYALISFILIFFFSCCLNSFRGFTIFHSSFHEKKWLIMLEVMKPRSRSFFLFLLLLWLRKLQIWMNWLSLFLAACWLCPRTVWAYSNEHRDKTQQQ